MKIVLTGIFVRRSRLLWLTLVMLLTVCSAACQTPEGWQEYRPADGAFAVYFPGKPDDVTRTSPLGNGETKYPKVVWNGNGVSVDVTYAEIPGLAPLQGEQLKEYYEFLRSQTIKMNHSQLMETNEVTVNGRLGQDFTEVRPGGKVSRYRLFLIGTKLLSLRSEQDVGVRPMAETRGTVDKFMTSLRFTD